MCYLEQEQIIDHFAHDTWKKQQHQQQLIKRDNQMIRFVLILLFYKLPIFLLSLKK